MRECDKYTLETLSDLQDNSLPLWTAWRVRRHINQCPSCAEEWRKLQALQTAARAWHSDATLSSERGRRPLPSRELWPARRPIPTLAIRGVMLAGMALALTGGAFLLFGPLTNPERAFAQIEQATTSIRTAQWTTTFSRLDCRTGVTSRWTAHNFARLLSPALRTEYTNDNKEIWYTVETPGLNLRVAPDTANPHQRTAYLETNARNEFRWPQDPENPQERFRQRLIGELLGEHTAVERASGKATGWSSTQEILNGKVVTRLGLGLGNSDWSRSGRLTKPGFSRTLWIDPTTHRVLRSRQEYYDGNVHTIMLNDQFRYDEPLPDALFRLKPPPGVVLRR